MLDTTSHHENHDTSTTTVNSSERDFHDDETSTYWLPKDEEEQLRLTGQHFAIKDLYQGNILSSVAENLDLDKGISILDVGCGSGVWTMDMASEYPNCTYEGCDIISVTNSNVTQTQVHYSYGNIVEGLNYPDNTFDFVYMRFLVLGLREEEWPIAVKEMLRVTKPGGMLQLLEVDFALAHCDHPNVVTTCSAIVNACKSRGQDPHIARKLETLVSEIEGVKLVQVDNRSVEMTGNTPVSKKFLWDWKHGLTSMLPVLGPAIGLVTEQEQAKFLDDTINELRKSKAHTNLFAVAAKKISS